MASSKEYLQFILEQSSDLEELPAPQKRWKTESLPRN